MVLKTNDLPSAALKRKQYEIGKTLLAEANYVEIGMDHFTLKTDSLYTSLANNEIHRNFMGYTASKTQVMIGLGVSAISDSWYSFAQNVKSLETYFHLLDNNILPVTKGHILNNEDLIIRQHILNLMCQFTTSWNSEKNYFKELPEVLIKLKEMENDGLIKISSKSIIVTQEGKAFIRNICMAFDLLLKRKQPDIKLFSMTI